VRIVAVYAVALAVAIAVGIWLSPRHPILIVAGADVAATLAVFCFSLAFDNSSVYDAYWSVAVPPIALYWAFGTASAGADAARQVAVLMLAALWAVRLTYNWARGWRGLEHEDWRYQDLRERWGTAYWPISLLGVHLVPTAVVFLGCLSLYSALAAGTNPFGLLDVLAVVVTGGAIWIEARADRQLIIYRRGSRAPGEFLKTGLWRYSRHPNYFGEILFWCGLFLFGLAASSAHWWTVAGALAIALLFRFISLPLIETRMRETRPGFEAHAETTSLLVPWLPKTPPRSSDC
jgi:steroid 5-alpha reductase family enzyme